MYETAQFTIYTPAEHSKSTVSEEALRSAAQGFNFVRAPLDFHDIFRGTDTSEVNEAFLENMDWLIEYCAENGVHICFDLHDVPGFTTGGDDAKIRLIFVDMLGVVNGVPVYGLIDEHVVQTIHPYYLANDTREWPAYMINGLIHRSNGEFRMKGSFKKGDSLSIEFSGVHAASTFTAYADGVPAAEYRLGTEQPGENHCIGIGEEGTGEEFRSYEGAIWDIMLPEDCSEIRIRQEDGWWYQAKDLLLKTGGSSIHVTANSWFVPGDGAPPLSEYQRAIWYGFVPVELTDADPDETVVTWAQFCAMLGSMLEQCDSGALSWWKAETAGSPDRGVRANVWMDDRFGAFCSGWREGLAETDTTVGFEPYTMYVPALMGFPENAAALDWTAIRWMRAMSVF